MTSEEIDARYGRADHLCQLGRWTDAERALGIVLGAAPDHLALAEALVRQGERVEAEPQVRAALDLDLSAPVAWQQLAEILSYLPGVRTRRWRRHAEPSRWVRRTPTCMPRWAMHC